LFVSEKQHLHTADHRHLLTVVCEQSSAVESGARHIRAPLFAYTALSPILWYHKTSGNLLMHTLCASPITDH